MKWTDRVGRRVKLRDLHIALAVADAGSMTRAAEELAVSYPVVSKTISDLEHTLGVKLFDRSISGVEPTHYGRALLKRGVAAFDELRQGVQDVEFLSDPGAGELRIGGSAALAEGIVLAVIDRLSRQYPRIVIHFVPGGLLKQYGELRERRIELAFARISGSAPEDDMNVEVLFEEQLVVVAGIENPWVHRRKIALAELVG